MAHRKEVFQSKVLQKLYPAAPKLEKESSSPHIVQCLAKKTHVKRKTSHQVTDPGDAGTTQSTGGPTKRIYTVQPPPADYMIVAEQSATLPQQGSINSVEDPAEESVHESDEEIDQGPEEKKRRRKRKKPNLHPDLEKDPVARGQSQTPGHEGEERISRNKKRKLKKKRHKEKLLSMGLMPRTAAFEFTYQRVEQEEEEQEEKEEERAAEVLDFLRTTMEIYKSDSSFHASELHPLSDGVDNLLSSVTGGRQPTAVLKQLHTLKAFVQQKDSGRLTKALEELRNTTTMSAEETTAVITLFQYWITDILPMQGDQTTGPSTKHL